MLLSFVVENERDLVVIVISHHHQVVLNNEIFPDLDDLLEKGLGVNKLSGELEELSHIEVTLAKVDALGTVLHALLIDATG